MCIQLRTAATLCGRTWSRATPSTRKSKSPSLLYPFSHLHWQHWHSKWLRRHLTQIRPSWKETIRLLRTDRLCPRTTTSSLMAHFTSKYSAAQWALACAILADQVQNRIWNQVSTVCCIHWRYRQPFVDQTEDLFAFTGCDQEGLRCAHCSKKTWDMGNVEHILWCDDSFLTSQQCSNRECCR